MFQQYLYHHHISISPSALLFPAVNPRRRFLIHNTVQEKFPNLTTLSVGQGDQRRTAVTFKNNKTTADASSCIANQADDASVKHQQQPKSQGQSQNQIQDQSQGPSLPSQQQRASQKEEKNVDKPSTTAKEGRRPEQLLYSPQRQGAQHRVDLRKETQLQQQQKQQTQGSKHQVQQSDQRTQQQGSVKQKQEVAQLKQQQQPTQGTPQKQQPQVSQQRQQQLSQGTPQKQQQQQLQGAPQKLPQQQQHRFNCEQGGSEGAPKRQQRDGYENSEVGKIKPQLHQQARPRKNRSLSCNSERRSSSQSALETPNERLRNDDLMRDSGAEENQQGRKRRSKRNKRQKDNNSRIGGGVGGEHQQCHHPNNNNNQGQQVNEKYNNECDQSVVGKANSSRKSESVQNLSVTKSVNASDVCNDDGGFQSHVSKQNEFNGCAINRGSESGQRKPMKNHKDSVTNWRDTTVTSQRQDSSTSALCKEWNNTI